MNRRIGIASLMAMFFLASVSAFGADKIKNKGVVTLRNGDTLTVKTSEGVFTVTINSDTKIRHPVGLTGIRKKQDTSDVLIPGLKMKFEGEGGGQENQVIAKTIDFDTDDLALAEVIQAGLNPTAQQQARNVQAISANEAGVATHRTSISASHDEDASTQQEGAAHKSNINQVTRS